MSKKKKKLGRIPKPKFRYDPEDIKEFILESNAIEGVLDLKSYKDALRAWFHLSSKRKLTLKTILDTHRLMMWNIAPKIAGKWRNCDVWIGGQRKIFVSESLIKDDISNFLLNMGVSPQLPIEDLERIVKENHVKFEFIHPFVDGNGRVGRMLMNWQRLRLKMPIKIIHTGEEQWDYYRWFRGE